MSDTNDEVHRPAAPKVVSEVIVEAHLEARTKVVEDLKTPSREVPLNDSCLQENLPMLILAMITRC